jgi:8-oxo-dGTP diphosphatase
MNQEQPMVGVGVLVFKDGKILLGKRKGAHGAGEYGGTGGHLEHMESIIECAKRETREEAKIEITNVRFLCLTNVKDYAPKHYIDIGMIADLESGDPTVVESDKRESWDWYDINDLTKPLFGMLPNYIEAYNTGRTFFDA